jgi:hypothetical protein
MNPRGTRLGLGTAWSKVGIAHRTCSRSRCSDAYPEPPTAPTTVAVEERADAAEAAASLN